MEVVHRELFALEVGVLSSVCGKEAAVCSISQARSQVAETICLDLAHMLCQKYDAAAVRNGNVRCRIVPTAGIGNSSGYVLCMLDVGVRC